MEIYSSTTRFALACNQSTKIIEPIQSRCAVLRFTRLSDAEVLVRLQQVCFSETVSFEQSGLEAIIFIAEGDLRNALNALQSTVSGFGHVSAEYVFRVCDQPHPAKLRECILRSAEHPLIYIYMSQFRCVYAKQLMHQNIPSRSSALFWSVLSACNGNTVACQRVVMDLWGAGYAATDIIQTLFRVRQTCPMFCWNLCDLTGKRIVLCCQRSLGRWTCRNHRNWNLFEKSVLVTCEYPRGSIRNCSSSAVCPGYVLSTTRRGRLRATGLLLRE